MKITWATLAIVNAIYYLANTLTDNGTGAIFSLLLVVLSIGFLASNEAKEKK